MTLDQIRVARRKRVQKLDLVCALGFASDDDVPEALFGVVLDEVMESDLMFVRGHGLALDIQGPDLIRRVEYFLEALLIQAVLLGRNVRGVTLLNQLSAK